MRTEEQIRQEIKDFKGRQECPAIRARGDIHETRMQVLYWVLDESWDREKEGEEFINQMRHKGGRKMTGIVTDHIEVLRIKESIREGQLTLKTGMFNGRKLSKDEMWQVRKSVENSNRKIGESIMPEKGYIIEDVTPEGYEPAEQI